MVDRDEDAGHLADSKADPADYCESGISEGQFCFIPAMTTSLRSIGTIPPRNVRTLLIRYYEGSSPGFAANGNGPGSDYILADLSLRICVQREKINEVDAEP